jgi:hypothetical protein
MKNSTESSQWLFIQKLAFRFFFIYFILQVQSWIWFLNWIPGVEFLLGYLNQGMDWMVETANKHIFHVREVLVPMGGSGDTSYGWAQLWLFLCLAITGSIIWTMLDSKRRNYVVLDFWLRTIIRYYIIVVLLTYGITKIFMQQMGFPLISQLATPLGDLLPMRFSWLFIGYSDNYQIFSGVMEVLPALLMLYRRTLNLGIFIAFAVFLNVMMLNLCYDVPVKIFSMQMTFSCFYLLANNLNHFFNFFILNKPTVLDTSYHYKYTSKTMRWGRIIFKTVFIIFALIIPVYETWSGYSATEKESKPIKSGVYEVKTFAVNHDSTAKSMPDSLKWKDMIFEKGWNKIGSINTMDTLFRKRYNRAYFNYEVDTLKHIMNVKKRQSDSTFIFSMRYEMPDSNTVKFWTKIRKDSVYIVLKKSKRHFQLAERQFHWLSEDNR